MSLADLTLDQIVNNLRADPRYWISLTEEDRIFIKDRAAFAAGFSPFLFTSPPYLIRTTSIS